MHPKYRLERDNQVVKYEHDKKAFLDFSDLVPTPEFTVEIERLFPILAKVPNQHTYIKVWRIDDMQ